MRGMTATIVFSLLASVAIGGMSGTYTIKPAGGGDFLTLYAAGEAIDSLGMSGNCVFEIYGDTLPGPFYADGVSGSDSWTTTFRPGPGEDPVILGDEFRCASFHNVKIENLRFLTAYMTIAGSSGWRISGCRFSTHDWAVKIVDASSTCDTIDGNWFDVWGTGMGHYPIIIVESGRDNIISNNMIGDDTCGLDVLVDFDHAANTRFIFNTVRMSPLDAGFGNCFWTDGNVPCEVRNNVFVLAQPATEYNACVSIYPTSDSVLLDYNCYFVESLGYIGARPFYPDLYDWSGWRGLGFEANGINADPRLVSSTDLHLRPGSPCNQRATPIAGIGFDIDGDPRDPTRPDMGADEIAGDAVEERHLPQASSHKPQATVVRGVLCVPPSLLTANSSLLSIDGRKVLGLKSGANDVRALAPGIYFVREAQAQAVRKMVITR